MNEFTRSAAPTVGRPGATLKERAPSADGKVVMLRAPNPTARGWPRHLVFVVIAAAALFGSLVARPAPEAAASPDDEAAFVAALNEVRAGAGLGAFTVNTELADLSRGHAAVMADAGEIFHANPISAGYTGPWAKLGENVGVGANVDVLVDAFVASPGHYANIIDPSFTEIGVGVVWRDNALYTTHRFLQLSGASPTTTAPPPTTTVPPTTTAPPPTTTAPPPTTTAPPVPTTVPAPAPTTTTTTTLPPLAPPAISADRVVTLIELLEHVGT